jgi:hypothetical protein
MPGPGSTSQGSQPLLNARMQPASVACARRRARSAGRCCAAESRLGSPATAARHVSGERSATTGVPLARPSEKPVWVVPEEESTD